MAVGVCSWVVQSRGHPGVLYAVSSLANVAAACAGDARVLHPLPLQRLHAVSVMRLFLHSGIRAVPGFAHWALASKQGGFAVC